MNIYAIPGTSNTATFPYDANCKTCLDLPCKVARDFPTGVYNLAAPFAPSLHHKQKEAMSEPCKSEAAFVPTIIWTGYIPAKTITTHIAIDAKAAVTGEDTGCMKDDPNITVPGNTGSCKGIDMAGLTYSIVTAPVDVAKFEADCKNCDMDAALGAVAVVGQLADVDGTVDSWALKPFAKTQDELTVAW